MKNTIIVFLVIVVVGGITLFFLNKNNEVVYQQDLEEPKAVVPETTEPKTEILGSGFNAELTVSPSVDNKISGVVTVTVTKSPVGTERVGFAITGGSIGDDLRNTGPNIGFDSSSADGWTKMVDTTQYENGLYEISGIAFTENMDGDPLGVATAQVLIEN